MARYRAGGTIECLGRNDFQVKLRGHRIDLGEIESALRRHPDVREAVVMLREDEPGQKRLVAYLIGAADSLPGAAALQPFLRAQLPDYMVPGTFVGIVKFPLTPNGKINRKALPAPTVERAEVRETFTPPRTATENGLAQIWQELLRLPQVGIRDNFFEIGGHSLLAMQLMARVRSAFHAELSLRNIFESPTIAELAGLVDRKKTQPALEPVPGLSRARRISPERAKELLDKLDQLSDEEIESLLQQVPGEVEHRL
jgi:aryl carrier-like protein